MINHYGCNETCLDTHVSKYTMRGEVFGGPNFTTSPSINSIIFNKIDMRVTRSHSGAFENGFNVNNCVNHRNPDLKLLTENLLVTCVKVNKRPQTQHLHCYVHTVRSG
jgi:hypothetical protein